MMSAQLEWTQQLGYPNWRYGNVNVNVNRWNSVNVNRAQINSATWRPPATQLPARGNGPVGQPGRPAGLPANAVGRPSVTVPGGAVNRPTQRPAQQPARGNAPAARPPVSASRPQVQNRGGALSGVSDGARAGQYGARGNQSLQARQPAGGGMRGGGGAARGGGARGRR